MLLKLEVVLEAPLCAGHHVNIPCEVQRNVKIYLCAFAFVCANGIVFLVSAVEVK